MTSLQRTPCLALLVIAVAGAPTRTPAGSAAPKAVESAAARDSVESEGAVEKRRELHFYMKGRFLFQKHCVDCHGETGRGNGPWAEELETKPRNFRTGLFKFRTTPYGKLPVPGDIRRTIRSGISGTAMPFFSAFSDEDVDAIIVYLQNLSRSWNDPELVAETLPIPAIPGWFVSEDLRKEHAGRGAGRFAELCAICHGPSGRGDGEGGRHLLDVWGHPVKAADLSSPHHKSGDSPRDLYRTIATGLNGTPMIGYAGTLNEEEIWNLVAFIQASGEKVR